MDNIFKGELMALLPRYIKGQGNSTVLLRKGESPLVVNKTIKTSLHLLCKYYMVDFNEVRRRYRPIISSTNLVPISLSRKDIFIPFKTRIPLYKNDGAFSYVNMRYIDKLKKQKNTPILYLKDNTKIECLSRLPTIKNHIRNAKIISRCYEDIGMQIAEDEGEYL